VPRPRKSRSLRRVAAYVDESFFELMERAMSKLGLETKAEFVRIALKEKIDRMLIAIFLVVPLYNTVAELLNYLTSPGSGAILQPGMIQKLIEVAMRPPAATWTDQIVSFFMAVFFLIMVAVSLIAVGILGTLRIFFVGACVSLMPLLLVMRRLRQRQKQDPRSSEAQPLNVREAN